MTKSEVSIWILKWRRFLRHYSSPSSKPFQQTEELFQQQKPQIASVMGNVPQLMHAGRYYVPAITDASSSYKSQRRDGQKEEEGKTREERQDGGGKRIRKRNREAERKMGRQSEERKERVQKKNEERKQCWNSPSTLSSSSATASSRFQYQGERRDREGEKESRENKKKQRETWRRTWQHRETIIEEQTNRSKKNPTATSLHRCCPLTFGTRCKGIKQKRQKPRKKPREKVQNNKKNARPELSSSSVFLETRCVRLHILLNLQMSIYTMRR